MACDAMFGHILMKTAKGQSGRERERERERESTSRHQHWKNAILVVWFSSSESQIKF